MTKEIAGTFPMKREDPYEPPPELRRLQAECPVSRVRIWDETCPWLFTRDDHVRAVLRDDRFSIEPGRPGFPMPSASRKARFDRQRPSLLMLDDPEHSRFRRMLMPDFTLKKVEELRPLVVDTVDQLLDEMEAAGSPVDLVQAFALPLPSLVICHILGVPYDDHRFFQDLSHVLVNNSADQDQSEVERAVDTLQEYLDGLIERRQREPSDDLMSRLAARINDGELTLSEAGAMAWFLLVAGHETTANMIALGSLTLLRNPEHAALVRNGDHETVRRVVEELLRLLTITHAGRRRVALEDVDIAGVHIKAGEGVICASNIANRDPDRFDLPDELIAERGSPNHTAFGFGVHQCLGQPTARLELEVAYPALLRRFPNLRINVPDSEIRFREEMQVYGVHELPVAF